MTGNNAHRGHLITPLALPPVLQVLPCPDLGIPPEMLVCLRELAGTLPPPHIPWPGRLSQPPHCSPSFHSVLLKWKSGGCPPLLKTIHSFLLTQNKPTVLPGALKIFGPCCCSGFVSD